MSKDAKMPHITFATFHIDVLTEGGTGGVHPNTTLSRGEYGMMIDLMFRSARVFHPACRCVIISNRETWLSPLDRQYEVSIHEAHPSSLMLDRAHAMWKFAETYGFEGPLIFLDSDVLLNGSLRGVLAQDFDVALTYRSAPNPPVNGGVLMLNNRRPEVVRSFLESVFRAYQEKHADKSAWWGDQETLSEYVGYDRFPSGSEATIVLDGCRLLLLPCERYNFSPSPEARAIAQRLQEPRILHFKGPRKFLMPVYWSAYLAPRERWNWSAFRNCLQARYQLYRSQAET